MTYSVDFRRHVFKVMETEGLTMEELAVRFVIGKTTLVRWKRRLEPKTTRKTRPRKIDMDVLAKDVSEHPDAYIYERAKAFWYEPKRHA